MRTSNSPLLVGVLGRAIQAVALFSAHSFISHYDSSLLAFVCALCVGTGLIMLILQAFKEQSASAVPRHASTARQFGLLLLNGIILFAQLSCFYFGLRYLGALRTILLASNPLLTIYFPALFRPSSSASASCKHSKRGVFLSIVALLVVALSSLEVPDFDSFHSITPVSTLSHPLLDGRLNAERFSFAGKQGVIKLQPIKPSLQEQHDEAEVHTGQNENEQRHDSHDSSRSLLSVSDAADEFDVSESESAQSAVEAAHMDDNKHQDNTEASHSDPGDSEHDESSATDPPVRQTPPPDHQSSSAGQSDHSRGDEHEKESHETHESQHTEDGKKSADAHSSVASVPNPKPVGSKFHLLRPLFSCCLVIVSVLIDTLRQVLVRRSQKDSSSGPKRLHALSSLVAGLICLILLLATLQAKPIAHEPVSSVVSSVNSSKPLHPLAALRALSQQKAAPIVHSLPAHSWFDLLVWFPALVLILGVAPLTIDTILGRLDRDRAVRISLVVMVLTAAAIACMSSVFLGLDRAWRLHSVTVTPQRAAEAKAVLDAHSDQHADKVTSDMLLKIARAYGTGSSHADVEFHGDELGTYPWLLLFGGLFSYLSLEELLKSAFIVSVSANSLLPLNALNLPSVRQASSDSMISSVKDFLSVVWSDSNSRRILIFLSMNFTFMFVELSYGMMTNSLSLISDSGHMLLDCMGLVIGLYASYIARIRPNAQFTYGYGRFEFMSGFVNAVFLIFIAYSVCVEAIERFASPPDIHGDKLVPIAVLGFGINMIGLLFFHDHAHSGSECSHGHSHGNANMSAIYLHILADALGSLGVITSSTLIYFFGWMILDPICSVFISALIFWSVLPLLKSTAHVLLQRLPSNLESSLNHVLKRVCVIEGVLGYHSVRVWRHSSELLVGSVHVRIANDCDAQSVSNQVSTMFREQLHINQMTVQVETDAMSNVMQDLTGQPINVLHAEHAQHEHEHDEHHEHHGHSHDHSHSCGHSHDAHPSIPTTPLPPPRRMSSTAPRPSSASVARPVSVVGRSLIGAPQPSGLNIERLLEGHMALNGTDIPASTAERIESLEEVLSSLGVTESAKGIDSAATAKSDLS